MQEKNKKKSYKNEQRNVKTISIPYVSLVLILLILGHIIINSIKGNIKVFNYSVAGQDIGKQNEAEIAADLDINNEEFWNKDDLGLGLFWTNIIDVVEDDDKNQTVERLRDLNIQLYITNDGENFTYVSETGISGRDPNIIYKDGVFYVATTPDPDSDGRIVVNIFKSTDLIHWTNISNGEEDSDPVYRYVIGYPDNFNKDLPLQTVTWSPKWCQDGDDVYLVVSSSRYTENGGKLVYVQMKEILKNKARYGFYNNDDIEVIKDENNDIVSVRLNNCDCDDEISIKESILLEQYKENKNVKYRIYRVRR